MVAGLTMIPESDAVDGYGIELDVTLAAYNRLRRGEATGVPGLLLGPSGGLAAYRRAAFEAAGGFDERLFAYGEDVDLALRLRNLGWQAAATSARPGRSHRRSLGRCRQPSPTLARGVRASVSLAALRGPAHTPRVSGPPGRGPRRRRWTASRSHAGARARKAPRMARGRPRAAAGTRELGGHHDRCARGAPAPAPRSLSATLRTSVQTFRRTKGSHAIAAEDPRAALAPRPSRDDPGAGHDRLVAQLLHVQALVLEELAEALAREGAAVGVVVPDPALSVGRRGEDAAARRAARAGPRARAPPGPPRARARPSAPRRRSSRRRTAAARRRPRAAPGARASAPPRPPRATRRCPV